MLVGAPAPELNDLLEVSPPVAEREHRGGSAANAGRSFLEQCFTELRSLSVHRGLTSLGLSWCGVSLSSYMRWLRQP